MIIENSKNSNSITHNNLNCDYNILAKPKFYKTSRVSLNHLPYSNILNFNEMKENTYRNQKNPINFNKKQVNNKKVINKNNRINKELAVINKNNKLFLKTIEDTNKFNNNNSLFLSSKNNKNNYLRTQKNVYKRNKMQNGWYKK